MRFNPIVCFFLILAFSSYSFQAHGTDPENQKISQELSESLNHNLLDSWYPRTIDSISTINGK